MGEDGGWTPRMTVVEVNQIREGRSELLGGNILSMSGELHPFCSSNLKWWSSIVSLILCLLSSHDSEVELPNMCKHVHSSTDKVKYLSDKLGCSLSIKNILVWFFPLLFAIGLAENMGKEQNIKYLKITNYRRPTSIFYNL